MSNQGAWAWDSTNEKWVKVAVDINGYLKVVKG